MRHGIRIRHPDGAWVYVTAPNGSGITDRPEMAWSVDRNSGDLTRRAGLLRDDDPSCQAEPCLIPEPS